MWFDLKGNHKSGYLRKVPEEADLCVRYSVDILLCYCYADSVFVLRTSL